MLILILNKSEPFQCLESTGLPHGFHKSACFYCRLHIVHTQDMRALHHSNRVEHGRPVESILRRRFQQFVNHGFPTHPHQKWRMKFVKVLKTVHQAIVVLQGLSKTKARIYDYILATSIKKPLLLTRQKTPTLLPRHPDIREPSASFRDFPSCA